MTNLEEITRYAKSCINGEIPSGQKHKWACERFLNDLNRVGDPDFPYIWDEERADKIVKCCCSSITVKESCQDSRSG